MARWARRLVRCSSSLGQDDSRDMRLLLNNIAGAWKYLNAEPPNVEVAKLLLVWADRCGDRFRPEGQGADRPEAFLQARRLDAEADQELDDLMRAESTRSRPTPNRDYPADHQEKDVSK